MYKEYTHIIHNSKIGESWGLALDLETLDMKKPPEMSGGGKYAVAQALRYIALTGTRERPTTLKRDLFQSPRRTLFGDKTCNAGKPPQTLSLVDSPPVSS